MSAVTDLSYELPIQRAPDAAALACSLFTRHQRRVYRHCLFHLSSQQDAEDALQQTFVNALKALQAGVRPRAEAAWLLEIARNVCLERHRSSSRKARHEVSACPDALDTLPSPAGPTDDEASELCAALDRIDPRQREALLLREWRGLSYKEVAGVLELSQSAAEALLFRARRSLSRALDDTPRLRGILNLGNLLASHRPFLFSAAAKTAAVAACCGMAVVAGPALERAATHLLAPPRGAAGGSHERADLSTRGAGRVQRPRPAAVRVSSAAGGKGAASTSTATTTTSPVSPTATAAASDGDVTGIATAGHTTAPNTAPGAANDPRTLGASADLAGGGAAVDARASVDPTGAEASVGLNSSTAEASAGVAAPTGTSAPSAGASADVAGTSIEIDAPDGGSVSVSTQSAAPSLP